MTLTPGNTPPGYNAYHSPPPTVASPADDSARYGQVGQTPWTFAQTVRGTVATLAPWLIFIVGSQLLSAQSATTGQRQLSTLEDIAGGIFAFIITGVVELAFVIAPAYYTVLRREPGITPRQGLAALGLRATRPGPAIVAAIVGFVVIIGVSVLYSFLMTGFQSAAPYQFRYALARGEVRSDFNTGAGGGRCVDCAHLRGDILSRLSLRGIAAPHELLARSPAVGVPLRAGPRRYRVIRGALRLWPGAGRCALARWLDLARDRHPRRQ